MISFWSAFAKLEEWCNKYGKVLLPLLMAVVAAIIAYGVTVRDDVRALQREDVVLKDNIARVEKSNKDDRAMFRQGVDKIDVKIDGINTKIDVKFDRLNDDILELWKSGPKVKKP
jgi:hypothetical protein